MWLTVIQAKLTLNQCWSAVFPTMLGVAQCPWQGHSVTCIHSCLLAVLHKVSSLQPCFLLTLFVLCFSQLSLPLQVRATVGNYWCDGKYSTEQFSVTLSGGSRSQGYHGDILVLENCLAPPTLSAPAPRLIYQGRFDCMFFTQDHTMLMNYIVCMFHQ